MQLECYLSLFSGGAAQQQEKERKKSKKEKAQAGWREDHRQALNAMLLLLDQQVPCCWRHAAVLPC